MRSIISDFRRREIVPRGGFRYARKRARARALTNGHRRRHHRTLGRIWYQILSIIKHSAERAASVRPFFNIFLASRTSERTRTYAVIPALYRAPTQRVREREGSDRGGFTR